MSDNQTDDPMRDYACAIGSAILALNSVESEVFYLLDILGAAQPSLEGAYFIEKIAKIEEIARQHADAKTRASLEKIASEARRLADERNNFAHGALWIDAFTGEHKRRFVRRPVRLACGYRRPPARRRVPAAALPGAPGSPGNHRQRGAEPCFLPMHFDFCRAADWLIIGAGTSGGGAPIEAFQNGWHATR